ncbi:MAG TPA: hypothetical protein VFS43_27355 [Polyangiaceae bacterium]|nr:hypothetical protein [Polyangiaceae bacterium]
MARRVLRKLSIAAVALNALAGCSDLSSYSVPHDAARRSPRQGPVAVFASYDPRVGRELGAVVARGGSDDDVRELFPELVRKVQELGGNALVIDSMGARFDLVSPWATTAYAPYGCGLSCTRWGAPQPPLEVMTVELRGRALLVSPDELARVERGAP